MHMALANSPIEIGLIGFGAWAKVAYVPILREQPQVNVRAVAARTEKSQALARSIFGPDVELYSSYAALLQNPHVDAAMIGLPPALTTEACIAAVEAGWHVWFEPPLPDSDKTRLLLDLAQKSQLVFHADLELRYLPVVGVLRKLVSDGRIGPLLLVRVELGNDWVRQLEFDEASSDSIFAGLSTWYIDLIDVFVQRPAQRVDVFGSHPRHESLMEIGTATLQFSDGVVGEWSFNLRTGDELALRMKLVGMEGEAEADLISGAYRHRITGADWISGSAECSLPVHGFAGMRESVLAFLSAVRGDRDTMSGIDVYRRIHAMHTALRRSELDKTSVSVAPADTGQ